jgi:hypothetical protein
VITNFVMAGLVPAIHVFGVRDEKKAWMPGTSQDKPGHDGEVVETQRPFKPGFP